MSYVELKHRLADLALDAVRHPGQASWIAVALACAELTSPAEPRVLWRECRRRAAALAAPFGWTPTMRDLTHLTRAGLLVSRGDHVRLPQGFLPHIGYFRRQTARVLQAIAELRGSAEGTNPPQNALLVGVVLFNAGLFFECHEWLEALWKTTAGPEKEFHHGIVQVAAAFYHFEKHNLHGSRTLLAKGLGRLQPYPQTYLGIDLGRFRAELGPWTAHFTGGPRPPDYPRIRTDLNKQGAPRG